MNQITPKITPMSNSTPMNSAASTPIDPAFIHQHLNSIQKSMGEITKHISTVKKANQAAPKPEKPTKALQSESDAGDMSHYDPTLGRGPYKRAN